jgi:sn-glycerol 3-phosphate transport system substrate-binding protein
MNPMTSRTDAGQRLRRRSSLLAVGIVAAVTAAACSSGQSALQSGADSNTTVASTATSDTGATSPSTLPATTTTTPLADLPACPTGALDNVTGPVDITFWHAMANDLEPVLIKLTDEYNASQTKVHVNLENQTGYDSGIDKYIAASSSSRPTLVQLPEYALQEFADSGTIVPAGACIESSGYDTAPIIPRALGAYAIEGVQWGMPFNLSNPVLYYNKKMFTAAGLDPENPPVSLDELRAAAQQLVDTGAASTGIALDTGADSGGGWYLEQWFSRAGELYADNGNGRLARATHVLYANDLGTELMTFLQQLLNDGLAVNVGDNASGQDSLLKMADPTAPAAMTIYTSAALGTVLNALGGGLVPGLTQDDIGVGPMPGPGTTPAVNAGGASMWIAAGKSDEETAAAWDYITYMTSALAQSEWAAGTGYVPIRTDAIEVEPLATTYATDPRFKVAYDQLVSGSDDVSNNAPALGPLREVRAATARAVASIFNGADPATSLAEAATASDALIKSYNARN